MTLHPEAQKLADYIFSRAPFTLIEEAIASYAEQYPHDSTDDILPGWCILDIDQAVKDRWGEEYSISTEDAISVLERASNRFDANQGVNWNFVMFCVQELLGEGQITLISNLED